MWRLHSGIVNRSISGKIPAVFDRSVGGRVSIGRTSTEPVAGFGRIADGRGLSGRFDLITRGFGAFTSERATAGVSK
jgi:hypothetical protein